MSRLLRNTFWLLLSIGTTGLHSALSQDQSFSFCGSAGYGFLNLGAVDDKDAADVAGWTDLGVPLSGFSSVKRSPFFSGRATYRYTRDMAVSLYASYFSEAVSSSYDGPDATLHLDRSVGATDVAFGVAYYPPSQPFFCQWYVQVTLGVIFARASTRALGSQASKPGGVVIMVPLTDSEGKYKKTKTSAGFFVGADLPLIRPVFLKGEAGYRIAQVGELDGDLTRFGVQSSQSSTTLFDYSGFLISLGVGIEL